MFHTMLVEKYSKGKRINRFCTLLIPFLGDNTVILYNILLRVCICIVPPPNSVNYTAAAPPGKCFTFTQIEPVFSALLDTYFLNAAHRKYETPDFSYFALCFLQYFTEWYLSLHVIHTYIYILVHKLPYLIIGLFYSNVSILYRFIYSY
jgi:hypothetical protein